MYWVQIAKVAIAFCLDGCQFSFFIIRPSWITLAHGCGRRSATVFSALSLDFCNEETWSKLRKCIHRTISCIFIEKRGISSPNCDQFFWDQKIILIKKSFSSKLSSLVISIYNMNNRGTYVSLQFFCVSSLNFFFFKSKSKIPIHRFFNISIFTHLGDKILSQTCLNRRKKI